MRVRAYVALFSMVALVGCDGGEATLIVQVRTDLTPGDDFIRAEVVFGAQTYALATADAVDWGSGVRVAQIPLPAGEHDLDVSLLDAGGRAVVGRPFRVPVAEGEVRVVTILLTRGCGGVMCPLAGDDPGEVACLAGRCVEAGCSEETPEECGDPVCSAEMRCTMPPAAGPCASLRCTASGACTYLLDHAMCAPGVCLTSGLCQPVGGLTPPGPGHVVMGLSGASENSIARIEVRADAPLQPVSALLDPVHARTGVPDDNSASHSRDGTWLSMIVDREGCGDCLIVAETLDLAAAELVRVPNLDSFGGTAINDDGDHVVYATSGGDLMVAVRDSEGAWSSRRLNAAATIAYNRYPSIRRDDMRVLFTCGSDADYGQGVCQTRLDGAGGIEVLVPESGSTMVTSRPHELIDGTVLYSLEDAATQELWVVAPMASLVRFNDSDLHSPCVLLDGRVVASDDSSLIVFSADDRITPAFSIPVDLPPGIDLWFLDGCGE